MNDLLFNVPWWIPTVLSITGIALMVNGNRVQNERLRAAGAGVVLLAVAWAVMSYLVDTPKETCIRQTRAFVQSVVDRDWTRFDGLLDSSARFRFVGNDWQIQGADRLDTALRADIARIGVNSATVTGMRAAAPGDTVTTAFTVLSVQESTMGQMINSDWEFDWRKSAAGRWVISEIRGLRVGNLDVKEIRGALPVR